jgi:hypothetical protein
VHAHDEPRRRVAVDAEQVVAQPRRLRGAGRVVVLAARGWGCRRG